MPVPQPGALEQPNELTTVSRGVNLTVVGVMSSAATGVTVNGSAANFHNNNTFALGGFSLANGWNTFTAVAQDSFGRGSTNAVTLCLPTPVSYTYDANGNLTSNSRWQYTYDEENRLVELTAGSAWKVDFVYDGLRRRRIRRESIWQNGTWVRTNEVRYVYDGQVVVPERDINSNPLVTYTRGRDLGGTLQGAGGIGGLLARTDVGGRTTAYYHADGNGNVTALLGPQQTIVAKYLYDSFGNTLAQAGPVAAANVYRFSSKEFHPLAGLYYYGYRFYDPSLQRWVNRDPIAEWGSVNLYSVAENDPVTSLDAWGLQRAKGWDQDDVLRCQLRCDKFCTSPCIPSESECAKNCYANCDRNPFRPPSPIPPPPQLPPRPPPEDIWPLLKTIIKNLWKAWKGSNTGAHED